MSATPRNPWGLTDRQCEVVDSLTRNGYCTRIAAELGIKKPENVRLTLHRACKKVGVSCSVLLALEWDRWKRSVAS